MNRKRFLSIVSISMAFMVVAWTTGPAKATAAESTRSTSESGFTERRPNIIFVHADDWDGRLLGCMGHPAMKRATPNIDRLATRGTMFHNAYSTHPVCVPSRSNMWSGKYTHHLESWNNHKGLEPGAPTFQTRLEKAGYRFASKQGGLGKHDYMSGGHSLRASVASWIAAADIRLPLFRIKPPIIQNNRKKKVCLGDWANVNQAKKFLEAYATDKQPFLLYLGLHTPHPPYVTSREWWERIDEAGVTIPPLDEQDHPVLEFQRISKDWQYGFSGEMALKLRRVYFAMCAEGDALVGEILDKMDELGLADNTYFIFSSDHGDNALEHRQIYKMNGYESSARAPLVIAGPGVRKGAKLDNIVSLIDIYPTLMDMARVERPEGLDGESLMPLLKGKTTTSRNWALTEYTGCAANTTIFMLRQGDWKYIAYPGYEPQLFNLADDPDEICNRAATDADMVNEMDKKLRQIVDYQEVHERCMRYNKASFLKWRAEAKAGKHFIKHRGQKISDTPNTYEELMNHIYIGWSAEHEAQLNQWLNEE